MRLLHILPGFNPAMGGTLAFVKAWMFDSAKQGESSQVVALHPANEPIESEGCDVIGITSRSGTYRYSQGLIPWLEKNISNFDAVVIHGIWQYHSFAAWKVLRHHSVPYFVFPHGMLDDWFRRTYPFKHLKKYLYWWIAESKVLRDAKAVVFTSEGEQKSSTNAFFPYQANEIVTSLGIPEPSCHGDPQKERFFGEYPELRGKRILLFLGRLHHKKGCDLLIRSFGVVAEKEPNLVLVMAGPEGEVGYRERLVNLSRAIVPDSLKRVIWTGMLTGDCKWGALRAAEAFVLPSHQENFGMAVVESLACGTPVLISNRVNIWREILNGNAGLVEDDTEEGTVLLLQKWSQLPDSERGKFRLHARRTFESKFRIEESTQQLNRMMENLK